MKYRYLGSSGLLVSRVCLGTMTFGNNEWGCDQAESTAIINRFLEAGGTFIDTADLYSSGVSEEIVGKALKGKKRSDLVIATKCWFPTGEMPTDRGLSRKHIIDACEASLRRLGTDYIDLYQIHGPDPYTPIEETMSALRDLVVSGKARYLGCSNLYGWQIVKANMTAEAIGGYRFISSQNLYNLVRRDVEREILPACADQGMGMICWSPLAAGMLTGKYRGQERPDPDSRIGKNARTYLPRYWWEGSFRMVDETAAVAVELGKTPAQVALAWLLGDRRVTAASVGSRTVEQVGENLEVGEYELPEESRDRLTAAMPLDHGHPKEWMDDSFQWTFQHAEFDPPHSQRLP
jgi:aryl-alcohol dehydrogenase-like predicted oxidoreductase